MSRIGKQPIPVPDGVTIDKVEEGALAFGLEEVARIRAEIAVVGGRVFGTEDVAEIQRRLREDPSLTLAEELVAKLEDAGSGSDVVPNFGASDADLGKTAAVDPEEDDSDSA